VIAKQMFVLVFFGANSLGKDTKNQCFTPENDHLMIDRRTPPLHPSLTP
jgi:hypothetical protein